MIKKYLVVLSITSGIACALYVIYASWLLATGWHIIPDLELGYTWNINAFELGAAVILLLVQSVGLVLAWKIK